MIVNDVPKKWDEPMKMKLEAKFKSDLKGKMKQSFYSIIFQQVERLNSLNRIEPYESYFGIFRDKYGIEWMVYYGPRYKEEL